MGHEAAVTKRKVLDKVELCVKAANKAVTDSKNVADTHDAFTRAVGEEFEKRDKRLNAQGEWIDKVETGATAALELATALDDRLNALVNEVAVLRSREATLLRLTVWQRIRLALTGRWPVPVPQYASPLAASILANPQARTYQGIDRTKPTALLVNEGHASPLAEAFRR